MSIESAKSKLQDEAKGCGGLEKAIAAHLISVMDEELAALVERPDYTVKEMGSFVMTKARKELNSQSGCLADEVVYGFATDYYHATREEIKKNGQISTPSKAPTNKTKPEKTEVKAAKPPKSIKAQEKAEKAAAQKPVEVSENENLKEVVTPLGGMSSIPVGNMSYVMTASEVFIPGLDNPIVRVHVGGKDIDVNINEVDLKMPRQLRCLHTVSMQMPMIQELDTLLAATVC